MSHVTSLTGSGITAKQFKDTSIVLELTHVDMDVVALSAFQAEVCVVLLYNSSVVPIGASLAHSV